MDDNVLLSTFFYNLFWYRYNRSGPNPLCSTKISVSEILCSFYFLHEYKFIT
jgi:hypothetical protein